MTKTLTDPSRRLKIAVIGSRKLDNNVLGFMQCMVYHIYDLRRDTEFDSGGAKDGPDDIVTTAAQNLDDFRHKIFLDKTSKMQYQRFKGTAVFCYEDQFHTNPAYAEWIKKLHPNPKAVLDQPSYFGLHARNLNIITGGDLDTPVDLVMYGAPTDKAGLPTGGTRTGVAYAKALGIPSFNFLVMREMADFIRYIDPYLSYTA